MGKIFEFRPGSYIDPVNGTVGTNTNGEFVRSEKGIAWHGGGTGTQIEITEMTLDKDSASIECWIKFGSNNNSAFILGNSDINTNKFLGFRGSNQLQLDSNTNNGIWTLYIPPFDKWIHIVITANGDGNTYIDGVLVDTVASLVDDVTFDLIGGAFGTPYDLDKEHYIGRIQIYDHVLTEKERSDLYSEFLRSVPTNKIIR